MEALNQSHDNSKNLIVESEVQEKDKDEFEIEGVKVTTTNEENQFELKENGHMVYIIFLFWGIGSLMTSSAIFATLDYYVLQSGSPSPLTTFSFASLGP